MKKEIEGAIDAKGKELVEAMDKADAMINFILIEGEVHVFGDADICLTARILNAFLNTQPNLLRCMVANLIPGIGQDCKNCSIGHTIQ